MDSRTKRYLILVLVVMAVFGVFVRGVILRPVASAAGPTIRHELDGRYENNCDLCHRKLIGFHQQTFGFFENCMRCHGGAPRAPHKSGDCLSCHGGITESHSLMFPKVSYEKCLGCHTDNFKKR